MISRRRFAVTAGVAPLAWTNAVGAQQPGKHWRIGYLSVTTPEVGEKLRLAFSERLRELGYVQGENITIEFRWAWRKPELLSALAAELVNAKVDVIVALTSLPTAAAANATTRIPIVFVAVTDPVTRGFATSLARPGENLTGLTTDVAALLISKRLQVLKEVAPNVSRTIMLWYRDFHGEMPWGDDVRTTAQRLDLTLDSVEIARADDIENALLAIGPKPSDAIFIMPDVITFAHRKRIADFAIANRLATIFPWREGAEAGGLASYGSDLTDLFKRAAAYVDKILKGAAPADLPVEQPTKFELVVNLKTAKALGLTIPETILVRADEVIE